MKTDLNGGPAADGNLEERLSRHFATELEQAERDYPTLAVRRGDPPDRHRRSGLIWPRLAAPVVAVAVLILGGLVGFGLIARPGGVPAGPGGPSVALGADGIPNQLDGQTVYRVGDKAEWQNVTGSFLLGAFAVRYTPPCPPRLSTLPPAEAALIATCSDQGFPAVNLMASSGDPYGPAPLFPAAQGAGALDGWVDGPPIVMRAHTHDAGAAQCSADNLAACEAAVVVETVVWPTVPTEIAGEHVYRATDQGSFTTMKGSFLLGGRFAKPEFVPPCPAPIGKSDAEQQLIPHCFVLSIDGLALAPMSSIEEPNNEIVVARVHVNDVLAAQCPTDLRASCQAAIVVEAVVWRSDEFATTKATASPGAPTPPETPAGSVEVVPPPPPLTPTLP